MNVAAQRIVEQKLVILVLEDEPLIAMDLQFALEDAGVEAHVAASCQEAGELLARHDITGAILDVNLGKNQTCSAVASQLRERNIPFVLHTGDLDRSGEAVRKYDALVIPKPTPASQVTRILLDHLAAG